MQSCTSCDADCERCRHEIRELRGLGAKVFYVVERGGVVWHDLAFEFRSGYRYPGGIIGVALALPVVWRWFHPGVTLARFADAWVPSLPFILAIDRMS